MARMKHKLRFEHRVVEEPNVAAKIAHGLAPDATALPSGEELTDEQTDVVVYEVMVVDSARAEKVVHWGHPVYRIAKTELNHRAKRGYSR
jgi:hypothetical protein